jgi:hypothetical protein
MPAILSFYPLTPVSKIPVPDLPPYQLRPPTPRPVDTLTPPDPRPVTHTKVERVKGIEPSYAAWEAAVLPLNYTRTSKLNFCKHTAPRQTNPPALESNFSESKEQCVPHQLYIDFFCLGPREKTPAPPPMIRALSSKSLSAPPEYTNFPS